MKKTNLLLGFIIIALFSLIFFTGCTNSKGYSTFTNLLSTIDTKEENLTIEDNTVITKENQSNNTMNNSNIETEDTSINNTDTTNATAQIESQQVTYINIDSAKEVALAHANLNLNDVIFIKAVLDYDDGLAIYEIDFVYNYNEYDYEINAITSGIISFEIDTNNVTTTTETINIDKAKEIALAHANLNINDVIFIKAVLDYDDGLAIYEIEFIYNNYEYDYEINGINGSILEIDKERR